MKKICIDMLAGFGATVILSARMLGKQAIELMPQFDMRGMMGG